MTDNQLITDGLGRKIELPKSIKHVIGVKAGTLRLLTYMGANTMIVGVEDVELKNKNPYNLANPSYRNLKVIGPMHGGDPELIINANPDLIFISNCTSSEADRLQHQTGIPVVALSYGNLGEGKKDFHEALRIIGQALGKSGRADSLIDFMSELEADLELRSKSKNQRKSAYIGGISWRGMHGITSTMTGYPPFKLLGINNLASGFSRKGEVVTIDKEQIVKWNPGVIFVDYSGFELASKDLAGLSGFLKAVKNDSVFGLFPINWYTTNYETIYVNSYYVGKLMFPHEFDDINVLEKANEIFNYFVGASVAGKMEAKYGMPGAKLKIGKN